ncbi:hypothetical protein ACHWQZ_G006702 [Mnemiopsis leidyi]
MILLVFDFDHTIVDGNTDVKILDVLKNRNVTPCKYDPLTGWTEHMKKIFAECKTNGVVQSDMLSVLKELKMTDGMKVLFQTIRESKSFVKVVVASDSNSWFIDVLLHHFQLQDLIDEVHTNPAHWNGNLLDLRRYTTNETCPICPINMCKSEIVSNARSDNVTCIIYVGDGTNDLCPVLKLDENDIACPREGYSLSKKIEKLDIDCSVVSWTCATKIVGCLKERLKECTSHSA